MARYFVRSYNLNVKSNYYGIKVMHSVIRPDPSHIARAQMLKPSVTSRLYSLYNFEYIGARSFCSSEYFYNLESADFPAKCLNGPKGQAYQKG